VPALQLAGLRLLQGSQASPKQLSAGSQGRQGHSARSDGGGPGLPRSASGLSGLSLGPLPAGGGLHSAASSSRSRSGGGGGGGAPVLSEWLQPLVALVEPPGSAAAAHLERPPATYGRLQLQLQVRAPVGGRRAGQRMQGAAHACACAWQPPSAARCGAGGHSPPSPSASLHARKHAPWHARCPLQVLEFLQSLFSSPEQGLPASLLPTDYFVHLHSLGFIRLYHALPLAAFEPEPTSRSSSSCGGGGGKGQPQLQLCIGHLKVCGRRRG
jgi:hypothetical protein